MYIHRWDGLFTFVCLAILLTGCGSRNIVKVSGVAKLDDRPLADVMVVFNPVSADEGRPAIGVTNSEGQFELTTFEPDDGAWVGKYKVTILPKPQQAEGAGQQDMNKIIRQARQRRNQKPANVANTLHPDYRSVSKTPLEFDIPADIPVTIDIKSGSLN